MIKLNHLQIRVPPEFRGREMGLVNAVASALGKLTTRRAAKIDHLAPIKVTLSNGRSIDDAGQSIANGIISRLPAGSVGGGDD